MEDYFNLSFSNFMTNTPLRILQLKNSLVRSVLFPGGVFDWCGSSSLKRKEMGGLTAGSSKVSSQSLPDKIGLNCEIHSPEKTLVHFFINLIKISLLETCYIIGLGNILFFPRLCESLPFYYFRNINVSGFSRHPYNQIMLTYGV